LASYCHKMIKETAKAMASEAYESRASHDNHFYVVWPRRNEFVRKMWPHFVETARHTLAQLLTTNLDTTLKDHIAEALIEDNALRRGRHFQIRPEDVRLH